MKKVLSMLAAFVAVAVGCSKEPSAQSGDEINVIMGIEAMTKASIGDDGSGSFVDGDKLTLAFVPTSGSGSAVRVPYTYGETTLKWSSLGLGGDVTTLNVSGCFPEQSVSGATFTFDAASASNPDLLLARPVSATKNSSSPINLAFTHVMHRLNVTFSSSDGSVEDSELQSISTICHAKSQCSVNLHDATVDVGSAANPTDYAPKSGKSVAFVVVPQSNNGSTDVVLKVTLNSKNHAFAIPSGFASLESGKQLNVNLDVKRGGDGGESITFSGFSIGGWKDNGTIGGTVDL